MSCWADDPHARASSRAILELTTQLLVEANAEVEEQQPAASSQAAGSAASTLEPGQGAAA
jgi:hypothetical protein